MSESSSVNKTDFRFEIGRVSGIPVDDYKANKKEKLIYEYLLKDYQKNHSTTEGYYGFFSLLDQEQGTKGVITKEDINIFLSSKGVQKKNISEDDVIEFLNKAQGLNSTASEKTSSKKNTDNMSSLFGLQFSKDNGYNILKAFDIKNDSKNQVVTPEMLALFENGVTEVSFDAMLESDGRIKQGFELFDLNRDGKLDDIEKSYFSSGGHAVSDDTSKLTLQSLLNAIENLDRFGASGKDFQEYDKADGWIFKWDSKCLYNALTSANYILDTMKNSKEVFSEDVYNLYKNALKEIRLGEIDRPKDPSKKGTTRGIHIGDFVAVNYNNLDKFEIASVLIHELTHHVLRNDKQLNSSLLQEVETFYMEYKLYEAERNDSEYKDAKKRSRSIQGEYFDVVDRIKKDYPNISEKDLAVEAFLESGFKYYEKHYPGENQNADQLRDLVKKTNNFVILK